MALEAHHLIVTSAGSAVAPGRLGLVLEEQGRAALTPPCPSPPTQSTSV